MIISAKDWYGILSGHKSGSPADVFVLMFSLWIVRLRFKVESYISKVNIFVYNCC